MEQQPAEAAGGKGHGTGRRRGWILLLVAAILLVPVAYRLAYQNTIFPGVTVAGVPLGGLDRGAALAALTAAGVSSTAPVTLAAQDRTWSLMPGESGLALDAAASVAAAFAVGRGGGPGAGLEMMAARFAGRPLPAVVTLDVAAAQRTVADLAATFDRAPLDAAVRFEAGEVAPVPPKTGLALDQAQALATLTDAAAAGIWPIRRLDLPYAITQPAVPDASTIVAEAEELLASPVSLLAGEERWELAPEVLAPMLTTAVDEGAIDLQVLPDAFRAWMRPITDVISRTATMPRFSFDAESGSLALVSPGVPGVRVDLDRTASAILAAARSGHRVSVATLPVPPLVADSIQAEQLGIRELIHRETSRFSGSPRERIHNIGIAAARFDGLLIPPEGLFSFNDHLGDVSEEEGYQKTKIIMDGATADGVGGGVCQVSTTVFRAAFWSGLPIVERQAHGYRVGYYEQGAKAGLDATIYSPIVDLKFKNDTGHWLLIGTSTNPGRATVTFSFYGTRPPNRKVTMDGPFETGRRPPPPARVTVDPSLPAGAVDKVELSRWGSTFRVVRVVADGEEERREDFVSHYRPTGEITRVGPQPVAVVEAPLAGIPAPPAP